MNDSLTVNERTETGSLRMKRMRAAGEIPAILYGHGEGTINLKVAAKDLDRIIDHGSHFVDLKGSVNDSALIHDVQWDAFGTHILHLDLMRVSATEEVEVTLPVELKGEAPGTKEGGVVNHINHEVTILCPARALPDKLVLNINELHLDDTILVSALELPAKAKFVTPEEEPVVTCALPVVVEETTEEGMEEGAEPEVIGESKSDDEDSEGGNE